MELIEVLDKIGLDAKQSATYLALLELGTASVYGIAKKSGLKRPTVYRILDELQKRGLVSLVPRAKKVLYIPESPERFVSDLSRKQELVKRFLPNMLALYNTKKTKPQILLFEGKDAVREVYEKILEAKEVDFFCTIRDVISVYPDFPHRMMQKTLNKEIKLRELLTKSPQDIEFAKSMRHSEFYEHRFAQEEMPFLTDNVLFDGNVVFFSYDPYIFAVMISSKGVHQSLKSLFNLAWKSAEPFSEVTRKL